MTNPPVDRTPLYRFHWLGNGWWGGEREKALFTLIGERARDGNYTREVWFDNHSNRTFDVLYLRGEPLPTFDNDEDRDAFRSAQDYDQTEGLMICTFLSSIVQDLPPDTLALILSDCGEVLWTSSDSSWDVYDVQQGYKPSVHEYQLPRSLPTLLRSQLTLVSPLSRFVDKVTYPVSKWGEHQTAVYKSSHPTPWAEIQTMAQLPANHPHIIGIECLILEELTGLGVIGFTTRFINAPTMDRWPPSRLFKLRWFKELLGVLDELHLQYGIHHLDLTDRNVIIDPDTDKLVLIDFGLSCRQDGVRSSWDDLKGVVAFLYQLITRDARYEYRLQDDAEETSLLLRDRGRWAKHPDVVLDHDAGAFYDELVAWLNKRRARQPKPPPRQITIPPKPEVHLKDEIRFHELGHMQGMDLCDESRRMRLKYGRPALTCRRPFPSEVDPARRLLATGRYEDEEEAVSGPQCAIAVPDPKRGFPQPPVPASKPAAATTASSKTAGRRKRKKC